METRQKSLSRREFLKYVAGSAAGLYAGRALFADKIIAENSSSGPLFTFGAVADIQYADKDSSGNKDYRGSVQKLIDCVDYFNTQDLTFVVQLGDIIDCDMESFDTIVPIFNGLTAPKYHVLGNHDFPVYDRSLIYAKLGMTVPYYDFVYNGWRFIVLDSNDVSVYGNPINSFEGVKATRIISRLYAEGAINGYNWNAAIGREHFDWLKKTLKKADEAGEKVILFSHMQITPYTNHTLWNADELMNLIESYQCVAAYINGHYHMGGYALRNDVHYLNLKGMVETPGNAYATISVYADRLEVNGLCSEPDRTLQLYLRQPQCL